ncbi:hypothetical protein EC973_002040 [Apophysomyces ossiformis]|uniref:Uncharacterized protein n=1 Tax=Apophysomyces ossiformis TaxID=679940 RepID=A0A8H7BIV9_9FUNG|nr:hypothetical protein EC973_002040 [Apophysomyces ossiformis]
MPLRMLSYHRRRGARSLFLRPPVQCEGVFLGTQKSVSAEEQAAEAVDEILKKDTPGHRQSLFHKGELTFGTFLGFCTGYLIKKVGKLFLMAVGVGFVFLQVNSGHWDFS